MIKRFFFALIVGLTFVSAPAFTDEASESFIRDNARTVLETLGDPNLTLADRTNRFQVFMEEFSDQRGIANFVIGKYARRFTEEERARYRAAFRKYSLTAYETQFDTLRGGSIRVTGSRDRKPDGSDSIVISTVIGSDGVAMEVLWRVLRRGEVHKIVDLALDIDGNVLWLAIEQRAQLIDFLDRNNGSANALITKLDALTEDLRAQASSS